VTTVVVAAAMMVEGVVVVVAVVLVVAAAAAVVVVVVVVVVVAVVAVVVVVVVVVASRCYGRCGVGEWLWLVVLVVVSGEWWLLHQSCVVHRLGLPSPSLACWADPAPNPALPLTQQQCPLPQRWRSP
jgi:hypothetical protein